MVTTSHGGTVCILRPDEKSYTVTVWQHTKKSFVPLLHTMSGWLSVQCLRLSHGRSWVLSRLGQTKDHHKNAMRLGSRLTVQLDCLKGRVVCGTVYGEMHLKDLMGSIAKEGYCIPVPVFAAEKALLQTGAFAE